MAAADLERRRPLQTSDPEQVIKPYHGRALLQKACSSALSRVKALTVRDAANEDSCPRVAVRSPICVPFKAVETGHPQVEARSSPTVRARFRARVLGAYSSFNVQYFVFLAAAQPMP